MIHDMNMTTEYDIQHNNINVKYKYTYLTFNSALNKKYNA